MLLAGLVSVKSASISRSEERAYHDVKSWRHLSFDTHSGILRRSIIWIPYLILGHLLLGMRMFITHSLLSKTGKSLQ